MYLHTIIRCAKNVKKIMWPISIISFLLILCFMFINNQNKNNNDYGIGYEHLNYDFNKEHIDYEKRDYGQLPDKFKKIPIKRLLMSMII